jgi:hypothetical protein
MITNLFDSVSYSNKAKKTDAGHSKVDPSTPDPLEGDSELAPETPPQKHRLTPKKIAGNFGKDVKLYVTYFMVHNISNIVSHSSSKAKRSDASHLKVDPPTPDPLESDSEPAPETPPRKHKKIAGDSGKDVKLYVTFFIVRVHNCLHV